MKISQLRSRVMDGKVPILLGVIGHRNIDIREKKLIDAIRVELILLRQRYRHSPFIILSALAEGADRLVAQIAMEELPARLIAVLPLPEQQYERDFVTEESKAEFRSLLNRALSVKAAFDGSDPSWTSGGEGREHQYARAGAVIVDHAQILFALWDGQKSRGVGGTADQVEWFRRGYSPKQYSLYKDMLSPLEPPEPGRMIWINPASTTTVTLEGPNFPDDDQTGGTSNIVSILARMNDYNGDVQSYYNPLTMGVPLAGMGNASHLVITNTAYQCADFLSIRFVKSIRQTDKVIYLLALGAVLAFNFVTAKPWAPWVYLGITFAMLGLAARIRFGRKDDRSLEYRCFAEAMRTLFFWRAAGVKRSVWIAFLSRQSGIVHWIRHAVRAIEFCQDCLLSKNTWDESTVAGRSIVKKAWVDNQKAWFAKKESYHLQRSTFWNRITRLALGVSFATAIVLAALTVLPASHNRSLWAAWVKPEQFGDYWQAALGLFAAGAVVARGFLLRNAHLELAKQYASQRLLFENASRILGMIASEPKPEWTEKVVLERLGQEALQEQAEWLWLRHTRPFEMPAN